MNVPQATRMPNRRAAEEPQENARDPPCPRTKRPSQRNCRSRNGVRRPRTDPAAVKPVVVPAHALAATPSRQIPGPGSSIMSPWFLRPAQAAATKQPSRVEMRHGRRQDWSLSIGALARSVNDSALLSAPDRLRLEQDLAAAL